MFTLAEENYVKNIFHLQQLSPEGVSTNAIAEKLDTKPSSATDMVQKLAEKKVLTYVKYKGATLTEKGRILAAGIIRKHRLWEVFLVEKLHFQWDEVHEIAEQLEHIQSEALIDRLDAFLGYPSVDPHGDPIPDKTGNFKKTENKLLSKLREGQKGICVGVKESSSDFLQYLDKRGIAIGTEIVIHEKDAFDDSMTISIGQNQHFITKKISENLYMQTVD